MGTVDGTVPNDVPRIAVGAAYGWNSESRGTNGDIRLVLAGLRDENPVHESVGRDGELVGIYVSEEAHRLTLDPARSRINAVLESAGTQAIATAHHVSEVHAGGDAVDCLEQLMPFLQQLVLQSVGNGPVCAFHSGKDGRNPVVFLLRYWVELVIMAAGTVQGYA